MRMDLFSLVVLNLREEYSEEAANELINSPYVASVVNNSETMQRIAINRYLTAAILKFRAVTNVDMSNLLFMLVNDGTTEEWMDLFKKVILPTLKEYKILGEVNVNTIS